MGLLGDWSPYTIPPNIPESTRGNSFKRFTGMKGMKRKPLPVAWLTAEVLPQRRRGAENECRNFTAIPFIPLIPVNASLPKARAAKKKAGPC
jgi:hypothetical protein